MTKEEMIRRLDCVMLTNLNHAIWCHDKDYMMQAREDINVCYGVMFSASILGVIDSEEFDNINHTLSHTSIKW